MWKQILHLWAITAQAQRRSLAHLYTGADRTWPAVAALGQDRQVPGGDPATSNKSDLTHWQRTAAALIAQLLPGERFLWAHHAELVSRRVGKNGPGLSGRPRSRYRMVAAWLGRPCFSRYCWWYSSAG